MDSPDCLLLFVSISVFYVLVFLFLYFLVVGSVRSLAFERTLKLHLVSYRISTEPAAAAAQYDTIRDASLTCARKPT